MSSARATWSTSQTTMSANGGHLTIVVVMYGFAPLERARATVLQLVSHEPQVVIGLQVVAGDDMAVPGAMETREEAVVCVLDRRPGGDDRGREVERAG